MTVRSGATTVDTSATRPTDVSRLYQEGMIAGLAGAATIAIWFLILDTLAGRPLYTPTVLGTALFRRGAGLGPGETLSISVEMVLMFTWVHGLVFAAIGGIASRLLGLVERNPRFGFGVLLLFVVFQFGFIVAAMLFAAPVLRALAWPAVLVANLLAAAAMTGYFWLRHPNLKVSP
ncbi:MAG: hypothetical protein HY727_00920 [Candidatus Rokubacteria bacterium]|nr:hypothetical protein [Candidatus Rokubacteria bacterium]